MLLKTIISDDSGVSALFSTICMSVNVYMNMRACVYVCEKLKIKKIYNTHEIIKCGPRLTGFLPDFKKGRALKAKKGTTFKKRGTPSPLP